MRIVGDELSPSLPMFFLHIGIGVVIGVCMLFRRVFCLSLFLCSCLFVLCYFLVLFCCIRLRFCPLALFFFLLVDVALYNIFVRSLTFFTQFCPINFCFAFFAMRWSFRFPSSDEERTLFLRAGALALRRMYYFLCLTPLSLPPVTMH